MLPGQGPFSCFRHDIAQHPIDEFRLNPTAKVVSTKTRPGRFTDVVFRATMIIPRDTSRQLDETLARLNGEQLLVIELDDLAHLLVEPDTEPFVPQRGPAQPGVDDLAATLAAAKTLPDALTVRVILPHGASPDVPVAEAQAALRSRAAHRASVVWRDATAVRNMGRRQLPLGLIIALLSWVIAYAAAAAATSTDSGLLIALFAVVAAITLTIAGVVSWLVIQTSILDWRQDSGKASAYELITRCTLEITYQRD
jgi:hypothetical protein